MNFELTDEQQLLREAAADALGRRDTIAAARAAADGEEPLDLWDVATEAGWSGLVVGEERGGAGLGLFDAVLVAEQCGRRIAGAGLIGHLPATLVLERAAAAGDEIAAGALGPLASGTERAAIVHTAPPAAGGGWSVDPLDHSAGRRAPAVDAAGTGSTVTLTGAAGFQPDAEQADLLVVPAVCDDGSAAAFLVESGAEGVTITGAGRWDRSRPLAHVELAGATGIRLAAGAGEITEAWCLAQAICAADALGVSDAVREMAVAYAMDRHAFGRPIGSYQAIKHHLVDMLRHSGTARSLAYYAGLAADDRPAELVRATACFRWAAERAATFATQMNVAIHGGIGVTWEHDAPYYLRRAQLSRLLLGGEAAAGDRIAEEVISAAAAGAAAA